MRDVAITLLIMIVAGWAAAGTPFRGDQALYTNNARSLADGQVLYRDLWDVANPAVYWFYELAGTLFGFNEDGIHLAEWLWFTAFVLSFGRLRLPAAIFIGAWYYCTSCADPSHLTKVEGLVAFPLSVSIRLFCRGVEPRRLALLVLAGAAAGMVVLFKMTFLACVLAAWLPSLLVLLRRRDVLALVAAAAGFSLLIGLAVLHFASHQAGADALCTLFIEPGEILKAVPLAGLPRLMLSVRWFVETATPLMVLVAAGLLATPNWRQDRVLSGYLLMLPVALSVILVQRWSWWSYHFLLLGLPLATIATRTWPNLSAMMQARFHSRRWMLVLPVLFLPPLLHGASTWLRLFEHRLGLTAADRAAARASVGNAYRIAMVETAWLADAPPGEIFVAGDPIFHFLSGRPQATRMHGWALELFTPKRWQQLQEELQAKPPRFIYIDHGDLGYTPLITAKSPELLQWLRDNYKVARESKHGTWWERR